jgi:hypothetical protein
MRELRSEGYQKLADLMAHPPLPPTADLSKEPTDIEDRWTAPPPRRKKKKLYQLNRIVEDVPKEEIWE